ncbi:MULTISPECIES: ExbD/TolR family protein [Burkholderia]|uniref:Biopolymer transporter ExbD n=1 Tax=Burkholderia anthina TaxID=179879 RepID=A0A6P2GB14_9BURK|nr:MULTISPECIES: biopolymer transporter ExbD [Burkholderia]AXK67254.1 biopolymer transporter ExbD [Burkholderia sp. IDO3]MBM2766328.1 biopolymer transporter ExbD [Burkholderia anthina]PCD56931.1 biopolymer transporter ExbD [Burkholderia sp. IDO3]VVU50429.1 transport-related membrane protein [Burkholderia anthina]
MKPDSRDADAGEPLGEINVTPLVDVVLVLLVIFLIAAPLMTHAIRVDLPKAAAAPHDTHAATVIVTVDSHGAVYVDGRPTAPPDVEAVLARHVARDPRTSVSLHADRNEPFGTVAAVIASIGRARVAHVAIATADGESGTAH